MRGEPQGAENFNPRAPCGARRHVHDAQSLQDDFNPRAPCGARRGGKCYVSFSGGFQPTRPLRGATGFLCPFFPPNTEFQPTRPLRGATFSPIPANTRDGISTHAPLAGRDLHPRVWFISVGYFNPRAPCGARLAIPSSGMRWRRNFNPRAPCGARRRWIHSRYKDCSISTHAPLAGRDSKSVQITMHIFAITDKFQMLLHRMSPVRAFCSFLMQENHADFGCEPPK